jgi:hypothetical protein
VPACRSREGGKCKKRKQEADHTSRWFGPSSLVARNRSSVVGNNSAVLALAMTSAANFLDTSYSARWREVSLKSIATRTFPVFCHGKTPN